MLRHAARVTASRLAPSGGGARFISGDDLSRRAMNAPRTVARVGEEQFFRDEVEGHLRKRKKDLEARAKREAEEAEKRAREEAAAKEARVDVPSGFWLSPDAIRGGLVAATVIAASVALYE